MVGEVDARIGVRRLPVLVRAWGLTDADVDQALRRAERGWGRGDWEFVDVERLTSPACPLDVKDGRALVTEASTRWAYTVHRSVS